MAHYDTIVVGLGGMGSAALYQLATRGRRVLGIERFEIGHALGSSHGESRLIRLSYFEDPRYVPLLRRAYENWGALGVAASQEVLIKTGIIEGGPRDCELVAGTLKASAEHGLPHREMPAREVRERFPAFTLPEGWIGVFQADAGFVKAGLAVRLHTELAQQAGAEIITGRTVVRIESQPSAVRVTMDDGATFEAGSVVLAAGAWMGELVPILSRLGIHPTRQLLAWFAPKTPELFELGRCPAFFFQDGDDLLYGFPQISEWGVKVAIHRPGPPITDINAVRPEPQPQEVERVRQLLEKLVPEAAGALTKMETCVYTNIADGHFVIDLHPDDPRIVVASPCSGHGFKFASVIGEILANLATTRVPGYDISLFRIDR